MGNGTLETYIPRDILERYEVHNYRSAAQLLRTSASDELDDIIGALRSFELHTDDIRKAGGNESDIVKRLSSMLRPRGWKETRIQGDLVITKLTGFVHARPERPENDEKEYSEDEISALQRRGIKVDRLVRKNFLDGHKVDFVKNRVAFDMEWNSKDQTFDRDLYAFRAFHECDIVDAAVLLTRGIDLNEVFHRLGPELDKDGNPKLNKMGKPKLIKTKYGASTTWMGKLLYRLNAGRHGGCPVLVFGITRKVIRDWTKYEKTHNSLN